MASGQLKTGWNSYSTEVEVSIIVRDFDYYFLNETIRGLKKDVALKVYAYWKPPGALQWVLKCVTETVYQQNCPFMTKMILNCELQDAHALALKFDVCNSYLNIMSILGSVETNLGHILKARARGTILTVPVIVNAVTGLCTHDAAKTGELFLRAEILRPCETALLGQFGLEVFGGATKKPFRLEISKLNEDSLFDIPYPYTLTFKSDEIKYDPGSSIGRWSLGTTPTARVINENIDRVLKMEIFERFRGQAYAFVLCTLRQLLDENHTEFPITQNKDGKTSRKYRLKILRMTQIYQNSLNYYLKKELQLKRIYAVDFSVSNWNSRLHGNPLHEAPKEKFTPYEEALQVISLVFGRIAKGESLFCGFGSGKMEPYMAKFEESDHINSLLQHYGHALCSAKMSKCQLSDAELMSACAPRSCGQPAKLGAHLSTLLRNILGSISYKTASFPENDLEYYVCFIFTDGVIADVEDSMKYIVQLAKLPISLVFVAVGKGDFLSPLKLETEWTHPVTGEYPCRKITSTIHYRSQLKWDSSVKFSDRFVTDPIQLFEKELFTNIEEQILKFIRAFAPNY